MNKDLLPEWLNLFLDDVETSLCLPILLVMILCTVQFIFNHTVDIGYTFYQNIKQKSGEDDDEEEAEKESGEDLMSKIKGFLCNLGVGFNNADSNAEGSAAARPARSTSREEEWDYCEEDDD